MWRVIIARLENAVLQMEQGNGFSWLCTVICRVKLTCLEKDASQMGASMVSRLFVDFRHIASHVNPTCKRLWAVGALERLKHEMN